MSNRLHHVGAPEFAVHGGSATAIGGGIFAAIFSETPTAATPALIVAYAGLITALGGQLFQYVKLFADEWKQRREARQGLQELLIRLDAKKERIAYLEDQDGQKQRRIDFLEELIAHNNRRINEHQTMIEQNTEAIGKISDSAVFPAVSPEAPGDNP